MTDNQQNILGAFKSTANKSIGEAPQKFANATPVDFPSEQEASKEQSATIDQQQAGSFWSAFAKPVMQDMQERSENAMEAVKVQQQIDAQNTKLQNVLNADTASLSPAAAISVPKIQREMAGTNGAGENPLNAPPAQPKGVYEQKLDTNAGETPLSLLSKFAPDVQREPKLDSSRTVKADPEWLRKQGSGQNKSVVQAQPVSSQQQGTQKLLSSETVLDAQAKEAYTEAQNAVKAGWNARKEWVDNLAIPNDPRSRAIMAAFYDWKIKGPTAQQQAALKLYDQELERCKFKYSMLAKNAEQNVVMREALQERSRYELLQHSVRTVDNRIASVSGQLVSANKQGKVLAEMTEAGQSIAKEREKFYMQKLIGGEIKDPDTARALAEGLYTDKTNGRIDAFTADTTLDLLAASKAFGEDFERDVDTLKDLNWSDVAARRGALAMQIGDVQKQLGMAHQMNQLSPTSFQFMSTLMDDRNVNQLMQMYNQREAQRNRSRLMNNAVLHNVTARAFANERLLEDCDKSQIQMNGQYIGNAMTIIGNGQGSERAVQYLRDGLNEMQKSEDVKTRIAGQFYAKGVDGVNYNDALSMAIEAPALFSNPTYNNVISSLVSTVNTTTGLIPQNEDELHELLKRQAGELRRITGTEVDTKALVQSIMLNNGIQKSLSNYKDLNSLIDHLSGAEMQKLLPEIRLAILHNTDSSILVDTTQYGATPTLRMSGFCNRYGVDMQSLTDKQQQAIYNGQIKLPTNVLIYSEMQKRADELVANYYGALQSQQAGIPAEVTLPNEANLQALLFGTVEEIAGIKLLSRGMNFDKASRDALDRAFAKHSAQMQQVVAMHQAQEQAKTNRK